MNSNLFQPDQPWLQGQPCLESWDTGCARLRQQLEHWLTEYSGLLGMEPLTAEHPAAGKYLQRLWACWSYHWRDSVERQAPKAPVDGWAVAKQLRAGVGALGQGNLGGDPLRDVVLAEAVVQRDNAATCRFEQDYRDFAWGLVVGLRGACAGDPAAWWSEFTDRLAGYTRSPGKLERYSGRCGLRNWLGTVVRRFVYDQGRPSSSLEQLTDPADLAVQGNLLSPEDELITRECLQVSLELVQSALQELAPADRLLLSLSFVDGLSGRDAARVLGIDPGTVSRRKARALSALSAALDSRQQAGREQVEGQDLVRHLLGGNGRRSFGGALLEALQKSAQAGAWS